eukprot:scaffold142087_cov130-Phaeocystis_antarctica.AAC.1
MVAAGSSHPIHACWAFHWTASCTCGSAVIWQESCTNSIARGDGPELRVYGMVAVGGRERFGSSRLP